MTIDGSITFTWGGDERRFRLAIDQCLALEEKRGCGLAEIWLRIKSDRWFVDDVRETIRLGLIGADVEAAQARKLVEAHCTDGNIGLNTLTALAIISAAIARPASEPDTGKAEAATEAPEANASPRPPSLATAQPSTSHLSKSAA